MKFYRIRGHRSCIDTTASSDLEAAMIDAAKFEMYDELDAYGSIMLVNVNLWFIETIKPKHDAVKIFDGLVEYIEKIKAQTDKRWYVTSAYYTDYHRAHLIADDGEQRRVYTSWTKWRKS